jgi:LAO/AO transport system kinase
MEIADIFVLNKADLPQAAKLEQDISAALALAHPPDLWTPPIVKTVATQGQGIDRLLDAVRRFQAAGLAHRRRPAIWAARLRDMMRERLLDCLDPAVLESAAREVAARRKDPYSVIEEFLNLIQEGKH